MKKHHNFCLICKALGNPIRLKIVEHLKEVNKCICGEVVNVLPISQSTVSQHLKVLKEAGLIRGEIKGPATCYCIDKDAVKAFLKMAKEFAA